VGLEWGTHSLVRINKELHEREVAPEFVFEGTEMMRNYIWG
jgi:hypothetical protein